MLSCGAGVVVGCLLLLLVVVVDGVVVGSGCC